MRGEGLKEKALEQKNHSEGVSGMKKSEG